MEQGTPAAKETSTNSDRSICFEMQPFRITDQSSQVSFLDVWGDPPIQSIKTSNKVSDTDYISATTKNRKCAGFRATLIQWGLILE